MKELQFYKFPQYQPAEGAVVFAANLTKQDRCIFESGKFIAGGEFPVKSYELEGVKLWFYMDDFYKHNDFNEYVGKKLPDLRSYIVGLDKAGAEDENT